MPSIATQFETLTRAIERHRWDVSRFLCGRIGCVDTAADLYQSIAEALLRRDADLPIRDVRAFLFRAARNAISNHYRAEQTKARLGAQAAPLLLEHDERSPETIVEGQETLAAIGRALQELPVLTRRIFVLYRIDGLRQRAIAERLGVSTSTVEKHVSKALSHCYTRLHD